jgi:hypothetical protein
MIRMATLDDVPRLKRIAAKSDLELGLLNVTYIKKW